MRTLIAAVIKVAVLFSFIGGCWAATTMSMLGLAELQAKRYQTGDVIDESFPLVVVTSNPQTQKLDQLNLVYWRNLEAFLKEHPLYSFRLQSERGTFNVENEIDVTFQVNNPGAAVQTVEVRAAQSDPVFTGRYHATDKTVTPLYFKLMMAGMIVMTFPIGLGVTCLLYYAAWKLANKRLQVIDPNREQQKLPLEKAVTALVLSKTRWREQ